MDFEIVKNTIIESQTEDIFIKYISWKDSNNKINSKEFAKFILNKLNSWEDYYQLNNVDDDYNILFDNLCTDPNFNVNKFGENTKYIYFPINVTRLLISFNRYNRYLTL